MALICIHSRLLRLESDPNTMALVLDKFKGRPLSFDQLIMALASNIKFFLDISKTIDIFNEQVNNVLSRAAKNLGFIKRVTINFSSLEPVIYLFKTLVLPILTYSSAIWSPFTMNRFEELNGITRKFLRYASFKSGLPMDKYSHDYSDISKLCNLY